MIPITHFLSDYLSSLSELRLVAVADLSGVALKTIRRAASDQPIAASDLFAICAAVGIDPSDNTAQAPRRIGAFNHVTLALFLNTHMRIRKLTVRHAADSMKVSTRVVNAICEGNPVNASNVVKACRYLGIHPFDPCERMGVAA